MNTKNSPRRPDLPARFLNKLDLLRSRLRPYADILDTQSIDQFRQEFIERVQSIQNTERQLKVALIGQAKSGKSSFLNALLFDGEQVLPQALFPTTSVLTHIEYCAQPESGKLAVTFYSREEWRLLERTARSPLETESVYIAKELTASAALSGLSEQDLPPTGKQTVPFSSNQELAASLARFVREGGERTPLVKSVTVRMFHPVLKNVEIIDTPGLNDPVRSRTEQARKSLQLCDAAFFLSRAGRFLDLDDRRLLLDLMPQKGLARMVLVGSLYDAALMDTIYDYSTLEEADKATRALLIDHAQRALDETEQMLPQASPEILNTLEQCRKPIFASAEIYAVLRERDSPRSERQRLILDTLGYHGDLDPSRLKLISGFDMLQDVFTDLSKSAETLLASRAEALVPSASVGFSQLIENLRAGVCVQMETLTRQHGELIDRQETISQRNETARGAIRSIYEEFTDRLLSRLEEMKTALHARGSQWTVEERTGVELSYDVQTVSDAKTFLPWTWRRTHQEVKAKENRYGYLDARDLSEITQNLIADTEIASKELFSIFPGDLCGKLSAAALEYAAESSANIADTAGGIRKTVQNALAVELPEQYISPPDEILTQTLDLGQIREESKRQKLKAEAHHVINLLTENLCAQLEGQAQDLCHKLHYSQGTLCEQLFRGSTRELLRLCEETGKTELLLARLNEVLERLH